VCILARRRLPSVVLTTEHEIDIRELLPGAALHDKAGVQFFDRPGRREAASHPCTGSAEKETSWAVPRFLGITQRVPIAVVVALTGEHFGFVMLAFFSVRFCSGNDRRDIVCW
jgi:hypothetical protein